jgi:hypothetical protein
MNRRSFFQLTAGAVGASKVGLPAVAPKALVSGTIPSSAIRTASLNCLSARVLPWEDPGITVWINGVWHGWQGTRQNDVRVEMTAEPLWSLPGGIEVNVPSDLFTKIPNLWHLRLFADFVDKDENPEPCGPEWALEDFGENPGRSVCRAVQNWSFGAPGSRFDRVRFRMKAFSRAGIISHALPIWNTRDHEIVVVGEAPLRVFNVGGGWTVSVPPGAAIAGVTSRRGRHDASTPAPRA